MCLVIWMKRVCQSVSMSFVHGNARVRGSLCKVRTQKLGGINGVQFEVVL
jgi:hypothetical protein